MKKIVLLSDGTWQSASKQHKTNVWRLYRALDLHCGKDGKDGQIAFYDDGVGAREFLPFKLLGGAFGWGLKRNVIEPYKALCRTYEEGDKIYLFGFSRGAFTVRMLAGMIAKRGLCTKYGDEKALHKTARKQFEAYRLGPRKSRKKGLLTLSFRSARGRGTPKGEKWPDIEFLGVWDTVEAYGFPIEEVAGIWDRLVLPLKFVDQKLSCKVRRACHALAVDEERLSFRPVLFDEEDEDEEAPRIEQVWFPGVHDDLGGGSPEKDLALVPLDWMISKVEVSDDNLDGLHFHEQLRKDYWKRSDWHGKQHDSRSGLGAVYRYKPRDIRELSRAFGICRPKVHRGVRERIRHNVAPYAPSALPSGCVVVFTRPSRSRSPKVEAPLEFAKEAMEAALDTVFWRRWLYFALLWVAVGFPTLLLCASWWCPEIFCRDWRAWLATLALSPLVWLKYVAPGATYARAARAWSQLKGCRGPDVRPYSSLTRRFREFWKKHGWLDTVRTRFVMAVVVAGVLLAGLAGLSRLSFFVQSCCEALCQPTETPAVLTGEKSFSFSIDSPCHATGFKLKSGTHYRFEVASTKWHDGRHPANADGFFAWTLVPAVPFRRHVTEPWLKLIGRVGPRGEAFAIGSGPLRYKAESDGELFLYVNDAVLGLRGDGRTLPYRWSIGRNVGTAIVKIRPLK